MKLDKKTWEHLHNTVLKINEMLREMRYTSNSPGAFFISVEHLYRCKRKIEGFIMSLRMVAEILLLSLEDERVSKAKAELCNVQNIMGSEELQALSNNELFMALQEFHEFAMRMECALDERITHLMPEEFYD